MKRALAIVTFGCVLALLPMSACFGEDVWTDYHRIDKLDMQDGFSTVWVEGNDGCNGLYRLQTSRSNFREKFTLLSGAFFAGHKVNIKYRNTHVPGTCEYPIIKVRVRQ